MLTAVAYVAALAVIKAITFIIVIFVAGPHAGLLPSFLEPVVLGLGWLVVLIAPAQLARKAWQRVAQGSEETAQR